MKPGNLIALARKVLIPAVYPRDEDFFIKSLHPDGVSDAFSFK